MLLIPLVNYLTIFISNTNQAVSSLLMAICYGNHLFPAASARNIDTKVGIFQSSKNVMVLFFIPILVMKGYWLRQRYILC